MGEWILREACREAASWPMPLQIAVNLSPAQFMHGDVVSLVHSILLETGLPPGRLELEITEGVLIEDFDRGLALLRRLKALGVRISMDDFGSGYSSLSYLQAFPFDKIKIDRAFVMNLGRNPQSAAIVRAVIDLGHGLEMSIVAEGVETQEQLGFLRKKAATRCRAISSASRCRSGNTPPWSAAAPATSWGLRARPARAFRRFSIFGADRLFVIDQIPSSFRTRCARTRYSVAYGGLRSCDHRRRAERRQHCARRRRARPAGDPAGAGRSRCGRFLGLAAADSWRSGGAGAPRTFFASAPRWPSATSGCGSRRIWCGRCALRFPPIPTSARPGSCGRGCCSTTGWSRRTRLPASATVDVTHHPIGNALKRPFGTAFEYSDCVVDDSRLVILSAVDAAARGAVIRTGARCTRAERGADGGWR